MLSSQKITHTAKVIYLPEREQSSASTRSSRLERISGRLQEIIGLALNKIGVPGAVRATQIKDSLTGQEITIHVSALFTRFSVNGRDYYFHRTSGKFDGTGTDYS